MNLTEAIQQKAQSCHPESAIAQACNNFLTSAESKEILALQQLQGEGFKYLGKGHLAIAFGNGETILKFSFIPLTANHILYTSTEDLPSENFIARIDRIGKTESDPKQVYVVGEQLQTEPTPTLGEVLDLLFRLRDEEKQTQDNIIFKPNFLTR